ncbi:MAG: BglG family transcription antiterminator [Butyricicoccus pullicaecorum]|nr:BglG family transcription antiterminator [Butyricicoccus pullicaecorum]
MAQISERGRRLLLKLIENPAWTLDQLAEALNNSKKTVSVALSEVEHFLAQWPGEAILYRRAGEGISLHITENQRNWLLHDLLIVQNTKIDFSDSDGRVYYILLQLLQAQNYLKVQDLCDQLFVSKGTAEKDLGAAEQILLENGIHLQKVRNRGMRLQADEKKLRNFYAQLVTQQPLKKPYEMGLIPPFSDQTFYAFLGLSHVQSILDDLFQLKSEQKLHINYASIRSLSVHIAVALRRVQLGACIHIEPADRERYRDTRSHTLAVRLSEMVKTDTGILLPEDELIYLAMHLEGIRRDSTDFLTIRDSADTMEDLPKLVDQMIQIMSERYHFDVSSDPEIKKGLLLHLRPAISRMRNGFSISNPCLTEIKTHYLSAFEVGIDCFNLLSDAYGVAYNEDEIAYLTMHIQAMVERNRLGSIDYRILVICPFGVGTSQLIVSTLRSHFDCFSSLDVMSAVDAEQEDLSTRYDFIITTVPLKINNVPVVVVNPILSENELKKIRAAFSQVEADLKREKAEAMGIFQKDAVLFLPNGITKEQALQIGCAKLQELGCVTADFYDSVCKREAISSTSYGVWAIPHGAPSRVKHSCILLCISKDGISWEDNTVKLIFLLALNQQSKKDFSAIFDSLYSLTCDYHLLTGLLSKDDPQQVIALLGKHGYAI